ncbi:hypothetical protein BZG36_05278 [Bifiguratus adelaidae]|uniref:RhoGAP-domain-containing protein n=1 Tax=Bifiguratus adelaidae TaxID=1938954 RepID=A0A261XTC4_9FUNG|nr:hypothetical protein BZG36_05278 [Bifiguratus adelaidae]
MSDLANSEPDVGVLPEKDAHFKVKGTHKYRVQKIPVLVEKEVYKVKDFARTYHIAIGIAIGILAAVTGLTLLWRHSPVVHHHVDDIHTYLSLTFGEMDLANMLPSSILADEFLGNMSAIMRYPKLGGRFAAKISGETDEEGASVEHTFMPGIRVQKEYGLKPHFPVVLVPGIVSTGLESWSTAGDCAQKYFRKRMWGTFTMFRAVLLDKECWTSHMSLDPHTGLDPEGKKIRAAQGLDAADYFVPGYWVWGKIIENLATIGYDNNNIFLAAYDWRLSYYNLEVRDGFFTKLKEKIEQSRRLTGKKSVIVGHSMGSNVIYYFFKWVEASSGGNGGSSWVEDNIESFVNVAGPLMGVPKALTTLLSGETRDTIQIGSFGAYVLEKFFSRKERAELFRTWPGGSSLLPKGGEAIWGNLTWAPDDTIPIKVDGGEDKDGGQGEYSSFGNMLSFPSNINDGVTVRLQKDGTRSPIDACILTNQTTKTAMELLHKSAPAFFGEALHTNYSFGITNSRQQLVLNDRDHRKWSNPIETRLPSAPSMKIYCLYGVGKDTERAYFYTRGDSETGDDACRNNMSRQHENSDLDVEEETTPNRKLDLMSPPWVVIDGTVHFPSSNVQSGVKFGEGDGTVPLLSNGFMCVSGWTDHAALYNPGGVSIITKEYLHEPSESALDLRGGNKNADHVDILGNWEMTEDLLKIVAAHSLKAKNNQLWNVIQKQKVIIHNLQLDVAKVTIERDQWKSKFDTLETEMKRRSRIGNFVEMPDVVEEDDYVDDEGSERDDTPAQLAIPEAVEDLEVVQNVTSPSPVPPPRSPYRQVSSAHPPFSNKATKPATLSGSEEKTTEETSAGKKEGKYPLSQTPAQSATPTTPTTEHTSPISTTTKANRMRSSVMPPVRQSLDNDPTIRLASPPPRTPYTTNDANQVDTLSNVSSGLSVPTSRANRRESSIIFSGRHPQPLDSPRSLNGMQQQQEILYPRQDVQVDSNYADLPSPGLKNDQGGAAPATDVPSQRFSPSSQQSIFDDAMNMNGISVKVVGSDILSNEKGKEVLAFILSVGKLVELTQDDLDYQSGQGMIFKELWRVEKLYSDFLTLDAKIKSRESRNYGAKLGKLPDKALFTTHAPSKVDQRKYALEQYLAHLIALPLTDVTDLCEFLSTNVLEQNAPDFANYGRKEGYLTKRGKNFGGWKSRYFVLKGSPILRYYDGRDGQHLGSIKLTNAKIGKQQSQPAGEQASPDASKSYRHAFLIIEQKKTAASGTVRHVLCAESDEARDEWVEALIPWLTVDENDYIQYSEAEREREEQLAAMRKQQDVTRSVPPGALQRLKMDRNPSTERLVNSSTSPASPGTSSRLQDISAYNSSVYFPEATRTSSDQGDKWPQHRVNFPRRTSNASLERAPTPVANPDSASNSTQAHRPLGRHSSDKGSREHYNSAYASSQQAIAQSPSSSKSGVFSNSDEALLQEDTSDKERDMEKKAKTNKNRMTFWGKKMFVGPSGNEPASSTSSSPPNLQQLSSSPQSSSQSGLRNLLSRTSNEQSERADPRRPLRNPQGSPTAPRVGPRQVFGVPLEQAIRTCPIKEGYELPAIVYRCIEYLDAQNAALEEGIYRLSGSSAVIRKLRDRFNQEGDFNILASGEYYDVHAVAGLLKMWLRELPTSVLTRSLLPEFLSVIDLLDRRDRVNELGRLVSLLPLSNYTLLRALTAHLIRVVQNSDVNKMTVRNVGIVFSPTLGIPAGVFHLFISEFHYIFWTADEGEAAPRGLDNEGEEEDGEEEELHANEPEAATEPTPTPADSNTASAPPAVDAMPSHKPLSRNPTQRLREEHGGRNNRNSMHYLDGAPESIVGLEKGLEGQPVMDDDDEADDLLSESFDDSDSVESFSQVKPKASD